MTMKFEDLPKYIQNKILEEQPKLPLFQFPNVVGAPGESSYKGFVFNEGGKHLTLTMLSIKKAHPIFLFRMYLLGLVVKVELELKG